MDKGKRWYDEALCVAWVFVSVRWLLFEHKLGRIFSLREAGGKVLPVTRRCVRVCVKRPGNV